MKKTILVVDDEKNIVDLIAYNLNKEGFSPLKAYDGESALEIIKIQKPMLVILDLMLPGIRGLELCRHVRKNPEIENTPIIMLTAKSDDVDKIVGFEVGADDYMTKPFNVRELMARVRAVLRRAEMRPETKKAATFTVGGLHIDYGTYEVTVDGKQVDMGPTELKLLRFLAQTPGRVYTRDQLLDNVWGDETFVEPRTVDVHISRLRSAIEKDKEKPQYILTVRGIGYKIAEPK